MCAAHACFPEILPPKLAEFPVGMTKLNLSDKLAIFWDRIWKEFGCPSSGAIKTNHKSRYKYEVRRLKRQADHIRSEKLAEAWCNSCNNDFWNLDSWQQLVVT